MYLVTKIYLPQEGTFGGGVVRGAFSRRDFSVLSRREVTHLDFINSLGARAGVETFWMC